MKKIISIQVAICLLVAFCTALSSCSHKCEFSDEWSKDNSSHWHECVGEDCTEVADKAEHTFDEGKITEKATQEADGTKTFTCTACGQTKTEKVAFTGYTEAEWNAAFDADVFDNFAYTEISVTSGSGVSVDTETIYKFTKDNAWVKMTMAGQSQESYAPDTASANELRDQLVKSIKDITAYDSYEYDVETKSYKATKDILIATIGSSTSDITLKFADGKLVEMKYTILFVTENIEFNATSTVTLTDYGKVVLDPAK